MTDDTNLSKLNALVGAALRGLVEAGASAEAIGAFATSYRLEAAQLLGIVEAPPEAPDLQSLVTQAVSQALADAGVGNRRRTKKPTAQKFYVSIDGKKTSVTISRPTATQLIESKGGEDQARQIVQQLATSAPANVKNRSKWIEERILSTLSFAQSSTGAGQARH